MSDMERLKEAVQKGDREKIVELVRGLLSENVTATSILNDGLIGGMLILGEKFSKHEVFIPEVLMAARAMQEGTTILEPQLVEEKSTGKKMERKKIVLGTVKDDIHDIGKNIVAMMLRGVGFEVIDLGVDVPSVKFVETAKANNADMIAMSALLSTTVVNMREVIDLVKKSEMNTRVKTLVGGAVVNAQFAEQIGADGYAEDAGNAIEVTKRILNM